MSQPSRFGFGQSKGTSDHGHLSYFLVCLLNRSWCPRLLPVQLRSQAVTSLSGETKWITWILLLRPGLGLQPPGRNWMPKYDQCLQFPLREMPSSNQWPACFLKAKYVLFRTEAFQRKLILNKYTPTYIYLSLSYHSMESSSCFQTTPARPSVILPPTLSLSRESFSTVRVSFEL